MQYILHCRSPSNERIVTYNTNGKRTKVHPGVQIEYGEVSISTGKCVMAFGDGKASKENNFTLRTVVIKLVLIVFVFFEPMESLVRNVIYHLVKVYPFSNGKCVMAFGDGKASKENNLTLRTVVIKLVLIVFVFFEPMESLVRNVIYHLVKVYPFSNGKCVMVFGDGKASKENNLTLRTVVIKLVLIIFVFLQAWRVWGGMLYTTVKGFCRFFYDSMFWMIRDIVHFSSHVYCFMPHILSPLVVIFYLQSQKVS